MSKVCLEFYERAGDADSLIGAVDVPAKNAEESAGKVARLLCRILRINEMDIFLIDEDGKSELKTVYL